MPRILLEEFIVFKASPTLPRAGPTLPAALRKNSDPFAESRQIARSKTAPTMGTLEDELGIKIFMKPLGPRSRNFQI